jgi:hypothetical protein
MMPDWTAPATHNVTRLLLGTYSVTQYSTLYSTCTAESGSMGSSTPPGGGADVLGVW